MALLLCIYDVNNAAALITAMVELLENLWKTHQAQDIFILAVGSVILFEDVKNAIPVCKSIDPSTQDWSHFNHIMKTVSDPKEYSYIEKEVVYHGKDITADLTESHKAYMAGDFYGLGYQLGNILLLATEGDDNMFLY
jgi:hypothetical protein